MTFDQATEHTLAQLQLLAQAADRQEARNSLRMLDCLCALKAAESGKKEFLNDLREQLLDASYG